MATVSELTSKNIASAQANVQTWGNILLNVKVYGAKGDGVTDDTIAIQSAITVASTLATAGSGATLYFPNAIGYLTTSTISIPIGISVIMDSELIYTGVAEEPALIVGDALNYNFDVKLQLNVRRATQSNWSNESNIGIKIVNVYSSEITVYQARGFTIGVQFIGDSKGCVYNNINLYPLLNNKYGVDITNNALGWCNENVFIGGRFGVLDNVNSTLARHGVRITSQDNGFYNDNNLFIKSSFELNALNATAEAVPILIEYGHYNEFLGIRDEGNDTPTVRTLNNSSSNVVDVGFGLITVEDNGVYPSTTSTSRKTRITNENLKLVFSIDNIQDKACYYDGATSIHIPTLNAMTAGSGVISKSVLGSTISPDYFSVGNTRGIGRHVDTRTNKRFILKKDVDTGFLGTTCIKCYDASGTLLTSADPNHPYVKTLSSNTVTYSSNFGGCYQTGSLFQELYFKVHDDVKYVEVLIAAISGATVRIRGFAIYTQDNGHSSSWTGYEEITEGSNLGTTPPTVGTWGVGKRIVNDAPTVGQPKAWICTVAGTPGTWVSEGNL